MSNHVLTAYWHACPKRRIGMPCAECDKQAACTTKACESDIRYGHAEKKT